MSNHILTSLFKEAYGKVLCRLVSLCLLQRAIDVAPHSVCLIALYEGLLYSSLSGDGSTDGKPRKELKNSAFSCRTWPQIFTSLPVVFGDQLA